MILKKKMKPKRKKKKSKTMIKKMKMNQVRQRKLYLKNHLIITIPFLNQRKRSLNLVNKLLCRVKRIQVPKSPIKP